MKSFYKNHGITLINLIVTIIVLLILAGIALNLTIGENGVFKRAQSAANTWRNAEANEQSEMDKASQFIDYYMNEFNNSTTVEQVTDENPGVLEGIGTDDDPYTINSIEDLVAFASNVTNGTTYEGQTVKLGLSLDFNSNKSYVNSLSTDYGKYGYNGKLKTLLTSGEGFNPIGSIRDNSATFAGIFDGNGNELINLYMNKSNTESGDYIIGLFGNNQGTIKNLGIKNCNITVNISVQLTPTGTMVSGIAGYNRTGNIDSCYVTRKYNNNSRRQFIHKNRCNC